MQQQADFQSEEVDLAGALRRLGGLRALYVRSAQDMLVTLSQVPQRLAQAIQSGTQSDAVSVLHSQKGATATFGLQCISERLATLEALAKTPGGLAMLAAHTDALSQHIARATLETRRAIQYLDPQAQLQPLSVSAP